MAKAPTSTPIGTILQTMVDWENYIVGEVKQRYFWESPEPGGYTLTSSADNVTWSPAGTWNPGSVGARYSINLEEGPDGKYIILAYKMTRTS